MAAIPALGRLRWEGGHEFDATLSYIVNMRLTLSYRAKLSTDKQKQDPRKRLLLPPFNLNSNPGTLKIGKKSYPLASS